MQDVHFGYTGEREVVGGVSLTIEPGQSVALVGPSGSGKSTILKLLVRLYDTTSGSIYLDGIEARELQQASPPVHAVQSNMFSAGAFKLQLQRLQSQTPMAKLKASCLSSFSFVNYEIMLLS